MSQSQLLKVADALTAIEGLDVYHYWRFGVNPPYCLWQENGHVILNADDETAEKGWTGSIDYFTKTEFDPMVDAIENAIDGVDTLAWTLNDVLYEDDTNLIHFSWNWELI